MLSYDRLDSILTYLRDNQSASVSSLSKKLYASEATVRRDLNELERRGLIKRIHGGAVLLEGTSCELPLNVREQQNSDAKRKIAASAARWLENGQVIFLDASSTVMYLAKHFENYNNLTIITNGMKTAEELSKLSHKIYCTGGLMLHHSSAYVGEHTIDFIRRFNADICFFSSRGLSDDRMITDTSAEETYVRRAMLEQSRKKIFMCDESKFGKKYCCNLCNLSQTDAFVNNKDN